MPLVAHIYNLNATAGTATAADTASVSVRWGHLEHPMPRGICLDYWLEAMIFLKLVCRRIFAMVLRTYQ